MHKRFTKSPDETKHLATSLGLVLPVPVTLALVGDLGAGKTCFVQGLSVAFQLKEQPVSPTFILISEHDGKVPLLHSDLYRVEESDLQGLGIEEQLELWDGVAVVEWANLFPSILPENTIWVSLTHVQGGREIRVWSEKPSLNATLMKWNDNALV